METMTDDEREAHVAATEAAMREAGVPTHEDVVEDFFGAADPLRVPLDSKQWVEHTPFNEGQRRKYLNGINRDVTIAKTTGDAKMRMAPGDERYTLLKTAITNFHLIRNGEPLNFGQRELEEFLEKAPPKVIDKIDKEVRKANPWLLAEASLEDLLKERDNLDEMIEVKRKEEAGNSN